LEHRYSKTSALSADPDPQVWSAIDAVTEKTVVLKTGEFPFVLREARCLLTLPHGMAPGVEDLVWHGDGRLALVRESVDGSTLERAAQTIPVAQVPQLARALCQGLSHVHRAGYVYADLKPQNILLIGNEQETPIRFLDFGFALHRFGGDEIRGGTAPYFAPELGRGWIADGRADLYSLGVMLLELYPEIAGDVTWSAILPQLIDPIPANRFPHAVALRDALTEAFGLPPLLIPYPPFGGGPFRGRSADLDRLIRQLCSRRVRRVLIQARPGAGLSRFLCEVVLATAEAGGPPVQILDFGNLRSNREWERALDCLASLVQARGALLLGLSDPSPGLCGLRPDHRRRLEGILNTRKWARMRLDPVDRESLGEIVTASLDPTGRTPDELTETFHHRTEGNLRSVEAGFRHFVERAGREDGPRWHFDPAALPEALATWSPTPPEPRLEQVPARLRSSLQICAQAGDSLPKRVATDLLERFSRSGSLSELVQHGYLQVKKPDRISFITKALWREAIAARPTRITPIDRWLHERYPPDLDHVDESIQASARAHRLGDQTAERRWLSAALTRADAQRRWADVLRLLAYPDLPPPGWTSEVALKRVKMLGSLLGADWTQARLVGLAGAALNTVHPGRGIPLLERAAESEDAQIAAPALLILADRTVGQPANSAYDRYAEALRRLEDEPHGLPTGVLDYLEARRALARGHSDEALKLATRAARRLRGTGLLYEMLSLQTVAAAQFPKDPSSAVATMKRALAVAREPEQQAQIAHNASLMYSKLGRYPIAVALVDDAIHRLAGQISSARMIALRILRAWLWADLDRIEAASREAQALIKLPAVQLSPDRLVSVRLLLGFSHLHNGSAAEAVRETAQAWKDALESGRLDLTRDSILCLIDALLDLGRWDLVSQYEAELTSTATGDDLPGRAAAARIRALVAQASARPQSAVDSLEEYLSQSDQLGDCLRAARYVHHLGLALLSGGERSTDAATGRRAAGLFREEVGKLAPPGRGYHRGRALLGLAEALALAGKRSESTAVLDRAISLARRIGSRGLLAECLSARAQGQRDGIRSRRRQQPDGSGSQHSSS
jgi:serine/threonine protein kinase/tetratricopeptide (TPR) repeat protein